MYRGVLGCVGVYREVLGCVGVCRGVEKEGERTSRRKQQTNTLTYINESMNKIKM